MVQIGDGGATGSLPPAGNITIIYTDYSSSGGTFWNGQLVFNSSNNFTISSNMSGISSATYAANSNAGGILLASTNSGTLTLSGNNGSFNAPYTVNGGTLVFGTSDNVGLPSYIGIGGGTNTGIIKLDSGAGVVSITSPLRISGRSATTTPHLQNVSGNNAISGTISLIEGGNQHIIQSDPGAGNSLSISGASKTMPAPRSQTRGMWCCKATATDKYPV